MRIPKPVVVGAVAALGLFGTGLASAAVLSGSSTAPPDEPTTTAPVDEPTTTVPGDQAGEPGDDQPHNPGDETGEPGDNEDDAAGGVPRFYAGCGDFTSGTHGDYVSKVAHDPNSTPDDVRAAAHSDCGKPLSAVHQPLATEAAPAAETSPPSPPSPPHPGLGHGPPAPPGHGPEEEARGGGHSGGDHEGAGHGRH